MQYLKTELKAEYHTITLKNYGIHHFMAISTQE